jgi:hypothetical protein
MNFFASHGARSIVKEKKECRFTNINARNAHIVLKGFMEFQKKIKRPPAPNAEIRRPNGSCPHFLAAGSKKRKAARVPAVADPAAGVLPEDKLPSAVGG